MPSIIAILTLCSFASIKPSIAVPTAADWGDCAHINPQAATECPPNWQPSIRKASTIAITLAQEAIKALGQKDATVQSYFTTWMGNGCNIGQVQAVFQDIVDSNHTIKCGQISGALCTSFGPDMLTLPTTWYSNQGQDTAHWGDCTTDPSTYPNEPYNFLHEFSHTAKYNGKAIEDGDQAVNKDESGGCYKPSCIKQNSADRGHCYNGVLASAYEYLAWAIHCKSGKVPNQ